MKDKYLTILTNLLDSSGHPPKNLLFAGLTGSHLYGMNDESSDMDFLVVYLADSSSLIEGQKWTFDERGSILPSIDLLYIEASVVASKLLSGEPRLYELLFLRPEQLSFCLRTPLFLDLQNCSQGLKYYAVREALSIIHTKLKKYSTSRLPKLLYHAWRLVDWIEMVANDRLCTWYSEEKKTHFKSIKTGQRTELPDLVLTKQLVSSLQASADPGPLHNWLHRCRQLNLRDPNFLETLIPYPRSPDHILLPEVVWDCSVDPQLQSEADSVMSTFSIKNYRVLCAFGSPLTIIFLHPQKLCSLCKPIELFPGPPTLSITRYAGPIAVELTLALKMLREGNTRLAPLFLSNVGYSVNAFQSLRELFKPTVAVISSFAQVLTRVSKASSLEADLSLAATHLAAAYSLLRSRPLPSLSPFLNLQVSPTHPLAPLLVSIASRQPDAIVEAIYSPDRPNQDISSPDMRIALLGIAKAMSIPQSVATDQSEEFYQLANQLYLTFLADTPITRS